MKNTDWIVGCVVYTGHETKLMMNSTAAPIKKSKMDRRINVFMVILVTLIAILTIVSSCIHELYYRRKMKAHWYLSDLSDYLVGRLCILIPFLEYSPITFHLTLMTFLISYNFIIPISLSVTIEFIKFFQAFFINCVL